eukprot:6482900-Amphidinium_carterae.1
MLEAEVAYTSLLDFFGLEVEKTLIDRASAAEKLGKSSVKAALLIALVENPSADKVQLRKRVKVLWDSAMLDQLVFPQPLMERVQKALTMKL